MRYFLGALGLVVALSTPAYAASVHGVAYHGAKYAVKHAAKGAWAVVKHL